MGLAKAPTFMSPPALQTSQFSNMPHLSSPCRLCYRSQSRSHILKETGLRRGGGVCVCVCVCVPEGGDSGGWGRVLFTQK